MATLEREFSAHWGVDEVFRYFRDGILAGSQSVTDGGGSVYETEGARFIVRVFERFSLTDRDLVSLSLLLADLGDGRIRLTGITAGCGGLEKLWTYGEEAFLKKLTKLLVTLLLSYVSKVLIQSLLKQQIHNLLF